MLFNVMLITKVVFVDKSTVKTSSIILSFELPKMLLHILTDETLLFKAWFSLGHKH